MKYIVFGGSGFIGSTIVDRLLRDGHELRVFQRSLSEPYRKFEKNEKVEWVTGDLQSSHDVTNAMVGCDAVVHLVSTTLPKSSNDDPIYDVQTNIVGTLQMLDAMVECNISRIVFISSGGTIYGNPSYLPIDEKHPTEPLVSYGITKLAVEKYLQLYRSLHGIQAVSLRVSNPYGERQRIKTAQGAVGIFINNAIKGIPINIWGDGNVVRDYIHVADVANAFAQALNYTGDTGVFNISTGVGVSLNQLLESLEGVLGFSIERNYLPSRSFDVPTNVLSNDLARDELGWSPSVSMHNGLARTCEWMKNELEK
jgi:UDP-glucose 4-epimerase